MLTEAPNTNTQNMPLELRQVQKFILYIYIYIWVRGRGREVAAPCCWSGKSFLLLWVKSREFVCVAPRERAKFVRSPSTHQKQGERHAFKGRLVHELCGIHNAVVLTRGTH
jgi:hypothetical protein